MSVYAKGDKGKCDRLFSQIVRARGKCEVCGKRDNLQCMHIVSRRYAATRCDEENCLSGCAGCHLFFTHHPVEFARWLEENRPGLYDRVWARARTPTKVRWADVYVQLKERAKELGL